MKGLMKVAPGLLVLGLVLMLVGYGMAGFSMENLSTDGPYEQKTFESAGRPSALTVHSVSDDIVVRRATDGKVRVVYYESAKEGYDVEIDESGALNVRYRSDRAWYEYIGINFRGASQPVEVFLPDGAAIPVDIGATSGELTASDLTATVLTLGTVNGAVSLTDVTADRIEAHATSGDMTFAGVTVATRLIANGVNGEINLRGVAADAIEAHTTSGSINLDRVDAQSATYRCVNGDVRGSVRESAADYTCAVGIVNGTSNIQNGGDGPRKLDIFTTSGDVTIDFAG